MNRALRPPILILLAGFVLVSVLLASPILAPPAGAHGSTQAPASRIYTCRFENPNNPMCATAWSANSQALYDWMEVNIGDAAGRHRELIPDGQLCSAGRSKYSAFDQPGQWPVTNLRSDGSGLVDIVYQNTAPHSTEYYRVYITRNGFDARTDSLAWADLELAYDSGPLARSAQQSMRAPLPNRDVPAILYIVWQRSDSPEAFYACSDVTVNGSPGNPPTTVTSTPDTSTPNTSTPDTSTPEPSTPVTPATTTPQTTGAPSTTTASPATTPPSTAPPGTAAPTPTPPTTAAQTTAPPSTEAPGTSTDPTAPAENTASTATTPTSAVTVAPAEANDTNNNDNNDTNDNEVVGATAESTGPASPASTATDEVNQPIPAASAADGVIKPDQIGSASASADDLALATQAAAATEADNGGGQSLVRIVVLGAAGLGAIGLVFLAFGLRRSDRLQQVLSSLLYRPEVRRTSSDRISRDPTSGTGVRTKYYDVRHASGRS